MTIEINLHNVLLSIGCELVYEQKKEDGSVTKWFKHKDLEMPVILAEDGETVTLSTSQRETEKFNRLWQESVAGQFVILKDDQEPDLETLSILAQPIRVNWN